MDDKDLKRISRLTAILTQLQTKRLITASELADRFSISKRTIYRDIKALEQAGIPILTEMVSFCPEDKRDSLAMQILVEKDRKLKYGMEYSGMGYCSFGLRLEEPSDRGQVKTKLLPSLPCRQFECTVSPR
ncbi:helix-turn-helix transcriptional regulator [Sphingobacterium zeae]|uniref:helix-turn-helix transcriptional regulator n=1 Tax=Sphingobacterium zeae TaxID=1776859 RepID=UPI003622392A